MAGVKRFCRDRSSGRAETIKADLSQPDQLWIAAKKRLRHADLIRLREDFGEMIERSVREL